MVSWGSLQRVRGLGDGRYSYGRGVGWLGFRWRCRGITGTRVCKWVGGVGEVDGRGMGWGLMMLRLGWIRVLGL